tara:strand:- start:1 stop:279 length:279 start_codon:yes stop_codon:yes gene_type:complete
MKKSARGKHRWVGFKVDRAQSRDELNELFSSNLALFSWRLFDILESHGNTIAILRVPLAEHRAVLAELNGIAGISTLTSSGKIRLVRKRLGN